jgi:hypothetical protein
MGERKEKRIGREEAITETLGNKYVYEALVAVNNVIITIKMS